MSPKITTHANFLYPCIVGRVFEKARKTSKTGSTLLELFYFASALPKVLIAALKDKKGSHDDMKENLNFKQSRLNYIHTQRQSNKKRTLRISNNLCWGRCCCQNQ